MKKVLEILTMIALLVWGAVFIYFYATGRIERHLDPRFRIYALIAGIGFVIVALFNLLTFKKSAGACNHDHAHGDECDHEHHHHHDHDHDHHEGHSHEHDHADDHEHSHDHKHSHDEHNEEEVVAELHEHNHDETSSGLAFALLVLIAPILMAAHYSRDSFSMNYLDKWGKIEHQMQQMRVAEKRKTEATAMAATDSTAKNPYANPVPEDADSPPGETEPTVATEADTPPKTEENKSAGDEWGEFTLEDLKKMVPQSSAGDFLLDVPQIFYTAGDRELMEVMEGISVETTAQIMEEAGTTEGQPKRLKAFRLFIECCAADARPLSVPVEFPDGMPEYKEMGWYTMIGKLHYSKENDEVVPILRIKSLESTTEPVEGLLY